ncbi:MAG: hypothetical protein A2068_04215 [Ignavibacteria bacterium GWB2_35_6b]|nr:MAG: hypothetical protein A2068_04215 [Ignavibacteria bacterium GWB2_35_6b]
MISIENIILFTSTGLLLNITPGPDMIYTATRSATQGRNAGIVSALGIGTGTIFHILAAAFGLSAILMYSSTAYEIIKWVGAAYLVYLGIKTILERNKELNPQNVKKDSLQKIYSQGVITNVLNPKVALFFLAFLPQFVDTSSGSVPLQILFLGFIFDTTGTIVNVLVAVFFGKLGGLLNRSPKIKRIQSWFTGTVFIGLGVTLALSKK